MKIANEAFRFLFILVISVSVSSIASANKVDQRGILRSDDGQVLFLDYYSAMISCPVGTHPTTIRELAADTKNYGAVGIIDTVQGGQNPSPAGYELFSSENQDIENTSLPQGSESFYYFYYNPSGYRQTGDLNNMFFASSWGYYAFPQFVYAFNGSTGEIINGNYEASGDKFAIRCFNN